MRWSPVIAALCMCGGGTAIAGSILDLQPFARTTSERIESSTGRTGTATLVDINPHVNAWYVLELQWDGGPTIATFHIENPTPRTLRVTLGRRGLLLSNAGRNETCNVWDSGDSELSRARSSNMPYAPVCDSRLLLRNSASGSKTQLEATVEFLRDHVWAGDAIVTFVKKRLMRDAFIERGDVGAASRTPASSAAAPLPAKLDPSAVAANVVPEHLGLNLVDATALSLGQWYDVAKLPGVFVSAIRADAIDAALLRPDRRVNALDAVETMALNYFVAFDLTRFDLGFALGTDHPRLDWSPRVPTVARSGEPGPDGIDSSAPLMRSGMVSPADTPIVAATFTGGFKREHGAFRVGPLAQRNAGSHYGFIEHGATFSRLQPGLATVLVFDDGAVTLKTWSDADAASLPRVEHARQNGVPLIEPDALTGAPAPGTLVNSWGGGNWSGSADENQRTLRAGLCLQRTPTRDFLIYGYFSAATPSAMTRVFQSYACDYAMHLDMNALEHTYLALYTRHDGAFEMQHLIDGMSVVDRSVRGTALPRFVAYPDNRDFFYLLHRQ